MRWTAATSARRPAATCCGRPTCCRPGRNLHGFDPFRLPSAFAVQDGARQADRLLARHEADGNGLPETVAMVLWGTDNLKTEGGPIAQALWLMGAAPRFDSYGRLCGAQLVPLADAGPGAGGRGDHLVRHLPRPAAAADQAAGGGGPAGGAGGRGAGGELRPQARPGVHGGEWRRHGAGGAAGVRQRGRGLWRQRQQAGRSAACGTTRTSWPTPMSAAKASPTACRAGRSGRPSC